MMKQTSRFLMLNIATLLSFTFTVKSISWDPSSWLEGAFGDPQPKNTTQAKPDVNLQEIINAAFGNEMPSHTKQNCNTIIRNALLEVLRTLEQTNANGPKMGAIIDQELSECAGRYAYDQVYSQEQNATMAQNIADFVTHNIRDARRTGFRVHSSLISRQALINAIVAYKQQQGYSQKASQPSSAAKQSSSAAGKAASTPNGSRAA